MTLNLQAKLDASKAAQLERCNDGKSHLSVIARAGTGKTTTAVQALWGIKGFDPCDVKYCGETIYRIKPSKEQELIWNRIITGSRSESIAFVAYNTAIAEEAKLKVPNGVEASTCHSMGLKAIRAIYPTASLQRGKTKKLLKEMGWGYYQKSDDFVALLSFVKQALLPIKTMDDSVKLCRFAFEHGEFIKTKDPEFIRTTLQKLVEMSRDLKKFPYYDFDDMIWLPVTEPLRFPMQRFDLLMVDEAQDLNAARQALVLLTGDRTVITGDPAQSIYAFTGADSESMNTLGVEFLKSKRGMGFAYLEESRRCSHAVVEYAQRYVPSIRAHEDNLPGSIRQMNSNEYRKWITKGSMILSRCNAPLLSECYRLNSIGKPAIILGKAVGSGLITVLKYFSEGTNGVAHAIEGIERRRQEILSDKGGESESLEALDRLDCLLMFCGNHDYLMDVIEEIEDTFDDAPEKGIIRLGTIHKSKGLEANHVFLLQTNRSKVPSPWAVTKEQKEQERNLEYVSCTRSRDTFTIVDGTSDGNFQDL